MRIFENKETTMKQSLVVGGPETTLTYYDLVKACLDRIPKGGLITSIQKKRLNVLGLISDKLKAGEKVDIEGDIYETLKNCVEGFAWPTMHQDLCDFEDYIVGLKEKK